MFLVAVATIVGAGIWTAFAAEETERSKPKETPMAIYPSFSEGMTGPSFSVEYRNLTKDKVDLPSALEKERIVLDGKEYSRNAIMFAGGTYLQPGRTWTHTIRLHEFLPRATPLSDGKHTLIVEFRDQRSAVMVFAWRQERKKNVE